MWFYHHDHRMMRNKWQTVYRHWILSFLTPAHGRVTLIRLLEQYDLGLHCLPRRIMALMPVAQNSSFIGIYNVCYSLKWEISAALAYQKNRSIPLKAQISLHISAVSSVSAVYIEKFCVVGLQWRQMSLSLAYSWVTSWENLFLLYANNKGTGQPCASASDQPFCCWLSRQHNT